MLYSPALRRSDTIVALSTPPGLGAIGVVRLSGPEAVAVAARCFRGHDLTQQASHTVHVGWFVGPGGQPLDEVVAALFHGPRSYTKEDVVELSFHGSPYILQTALAQLVAAGARLAEPGEFTLRAYLNGRFDLTQAEAVADLIAADNAAAHKLALQHLRGGFGQALQALRSQLVDFAALVEVELDFAEEDVEFADRSQLRALVTRALAEVRRLAAGFGAGNALKHGIPTVIVGRPNAGKSTLLNRLLGDDRAIVSPVAGTTRDVIEDSFVLGGYRFRLMDTAGLRDTTDLIEAEGVRRSLDRVRQAALVLYVFDPADEPLTQARQALAQLPALPDAHRLLIANKQDISPLAPEPDVIRLSALQDAALEPLTVALTQFAEGFQPAGVVAANQRHADTLGRCATQLEAVQHALDAGLSGELLALDLRMALAAIGELTGEVSSDEVLGAIFGKFCIGK